MSYRWAVAAMAALAIVATGCAPRDYTVVVPPGIPHRLSVEGAVGLAMAKFAEWEPQVVAAGGTVTPVRITKVELRATVEQAINPSRDVAGPAWVIVAEGSFYLPGSQFEPPSSSSAGTLVFSDFTGELLGYGT